MTQTKTEMLFLLTPPDFDQFCKTIILQVHRLMQWRARLTRKLHLWQNSHLFKACHAPACVDCFAGMISFDIHSNLRHRSFFSHHLKDEETEKQRGLVTCPRVHYSHACLDENGNCNIDASLTTVQPGMILESHMQIWLKDWKRGSTL